MSDALADDLAEFVAGRTDSWEDGDEPTPPEDAEEAHRLLSRLRWRERELAKIAARAEAEIAPIREWQEDRSAGVRREIERIERSLAAWMLTHERLTGTKTEKFPSGELRAWAQQPRLVVLDEDAAAEVIERERPAWVRTSVKIDAATMKRETFPGRVIWLGSGPTPAGMAHPGFSGVTEPAPEGYEWREALDLTAWVWHLFVARPVFRTIPHVALLWPTRPKFSYKTKEAPTP